MLLVLRRFMAVVAIASSVCSSVFLPAAAAELRVPLGGFATIQEAIDAALPGDTVTVAAGTYVENIDFLGKGIAVVSEGGALVTIIDGNASGPVVSFVSGEGPETLLQGFTIRNGMTDSEGGGITIQGSAPTVLGNIITDNRACDGAGVGIGFASPTIQSNRIVNNSRSGCSGGIGGGGIAIRGAANARITNNFIGYNSSGGGGAIALFAAGNPYIARNRIIGNFAEGDGGAISMANQSDAVLVQNLIVNNEAGNQGGAIWWLVPSGARGPVMVNNTIAFNSSTGQGSAIFADGFDATATLVNNIIVGRAGSIVVYCGDFNDLNEPVFRGNDVYTAAGLRYGGICVDHTGSDGNISASPLFVDAGAGDLRLTSDSQCVDAGVPFGLVPTFDFEGDPRVTDGNNDGTAVIDIGADEYVPGNL